MSMLLGSVLKGPHFHGMELVKLIQYRSTTLQCVPSIYLPLAGLSVSVTLAVAVAIAVAVDVGAVAVGYPYFFIASMANQEVTEIQVTWVV